MLEVFFCPSPFPTIAMLATNCCCNVNLFYVGNKRSCCIVLYCIVRMHLQGLYQHVILRNLFAYKVLLLLININRIVVTVVHMLK